MDKENKKKAHLNINTDAIKNVIKSKEVRTSVKEFIKSIKNVSDTFDINK